jgi:two-component system response regulator YesN
MESVMELKQAFFRFPQKRLFTSWMGSYAFILAIPLIISTLVYFQAGIIIENEINRTNTALLKQVQQVMDGRVLEVERFSMQLAFHPQINGLMYVDGELSNYHRYSLMQILKDFKLYKTVNPFIYDFYLFLPNSGIVLNSASMYDDPKLFFEMNGGFNGMKYADWLNLMNQKQSGDYMVFDRQSTGEESRKIIAFARSLPLEEPYRAYAKVMIMLDEALFRQEVERIQWVNKGTVFMIDEHDQVLASSSSTGSFQNPVTYSQLRDSENMISSKVNGDKITISYVSSEVNKWKYVSVLPSSVFLEKAQYIRNLTLISLAICLVGGIIMAYYFARRNVYPIHELIELLSKKAKVTFEQSKHEYEFIKGVVHHTFDEKEEINRRLEQQNSAMRANFLKRLLRGRLEKNFPIDDALTSYNMSFHSDRFAVILFYIEDYSELFRDSSQQDLDLDKKLDFVHLILKNIAEELAGQEHIGFVEEVDGLMACLMNFKGTDINTKSVIASILQDTKKYVQDRFHIRFTASVSSLVQGVDGIPTAYQEAVEAMEYKIVMGSSQIIYYEDIAKPPQENKFYYPIELEQRLINYMKAGQLDNAQHALQDLFDNNLSSGPMSVDLAKCLMFAMIGTMLKTLDGMAIGEQSFMDKLQPIARLFSCESVPEMKLVMFDILRQVCDYVEMNKKSHNTDLRDVVLGYISEHYSDVNLSITSIAEHMDIHSSYLSKFFKEQTGESMLDTINKTRLDKAKELLGQDWSIGDTAVKVGFYNSNAFIRVFKKYEGVTPGQFKSML